MKQKYLAVALSAVFAATALTGVENNVLVFMNIV